MAGSLNKVLLIGRLGADPEIKQMVNGKNVARIGDTYGAGHTITTGATTVIVGG